MSFRALQNTILRFPRPDRSMTKDHLIHRLPLLLVYACLLVLSSLSSVITFEKAYSVSKDNDGNSVQRTPDGVYKDTPVSR